MPRRSTPTGYGARQTTSALPNPNKKRRGPYKKRPKDQGPVPDHEHTYPVGGGSRKCIVCGLEPPRI